MPKPAIVLTRINHETGKKSVQNVSAEDWSLKGPYLLKGGWLPDRPAEPEGEKKG